MHHLSTPHRLAQALNADLVWTVERAGRVTRQWCRVQVTGFGYDHDDAWATNLELFKQFTDASRGVRRLGAAAVDLCHTALGMQLVMLPNPANS